MMVVKNLIHDSARDWSCGIWPSNKTSLKIYEKPNVIKNVFSVFNKQGISDAKQIIKKLGQFYEIGYSSVGIVK